MKTTKSTYIREIKAMRNQVYQAKGIQGDYQVAMLYSKHVGKCNGIPARATKAQLEGLYEDMVNYMSDNRIQY